MVLAVPPAQPVAEEASLPALHVELLVDEPFLSRVGLAQARGEALDRVHWHTLPGAQHFESDFPKPSY